MAAAAEITRPVLSAVETGRSNVSFETLVKLADGLDKPLSELIAAFEAEAGR